MIVGFALALRILPSQPQTEPQAFEAASIKPSPNSDEGRTPWRFKENPGGVDYKYITVSTLIQKAYGIKDYQLVMPRGYKGQEYDIVARAPANSRVEDIPMMLRRLLADRFHLTFHHETEDLLVYELVAATGGARLKDAPAPAGGLGARRTDEGMLHWKGNVELSTLAKALASTLRAPVVDKTGMTGIYNVEFEYAPESGDATLPGPTISSALETALGLKLQGSKDPIEMLVVDHLGASPTPN